MNALPFPVYDADHHLYEPEEAFTRYLPKKFQKDFYFVELKGRKKLVIGGMLSEFIPNPTFEVVARPGAWVDWFRADNPKGLTQREMTGTPIRPPAEWRSGDGRIAVLDQQGLHAALVFPTLASAIEARLGSKAAPTAALFHSLNQWTAEEWGFARDNRLFSVPFISLASLDLALEELDYVLKQGARAIGIRPAPVPDPRGERSFALPEYDPFWARVAEAGIFVCLHASDSGYDRITQWWAGDQYIEYSGFTLNTFQMTIDLLGRAITDSLAAFVCHGALDRHPTLKVAAVENGAEWLEPLLHRFDKAYGQMPGAFKRHPRDTFHHNVFVAPFYEDDMDRLKTNMPVERILFGSDYPHPEGVEQPLDYLKEFSNYKPDEIEKIFSTNLKGLLEGKPL